MSNIFFLFQNTTFDPEELVCMGEAFDLVKKAMPDVDAYDVARAIIVVAQRGVVTGPAVAAGALELLEPEEAPSAIVA